MPLAVSLAAENAAAKTQPRPATWYLESIGVYGFEPSAVVVLAALVTEDPLLLIGECGTGKTFLLNSLSEALGLEHRHYNASLIQFDDLVGFPYPSEDRLKVEYLETPATVWAAQSVLVDEISRCKPEHQNRLFSLVHERKVQGLSLDKLVYRWAAMNPAGLDSDSGYSGSEPLDPALADRFALLVEAPDWSGLDASARRRIADPSGEGAISDDGGELARSLEIWKGVFRERIAQCPQPIVEYAVQVTSLLGNAGFRLSPRRSRMISRSLLAACIVSGSEADETVFRAVLDASLPQKAWGAEIRPEAVAAAHTAAWDLAHASGKRYWLTEFHSETTMAGKVRLLLNSCPDPDTGSAAVAEYLARTELANPWDGVAFAMALYPAAASGRLPCIGAEGIADLGRLVSGSLAVEGAVEPYASPNGHISMSSYLGYLAGLPAARQDRARQLICHLAVNTILPGDFETVENNFHECVVLIAGVVAKEA